MINDKSVNDVSDIINTYERTLDNTIDSMIYQELYNRGILSKGQKGGWIERGTYTKVYNDVTLGVKQKKRPRKFYVYRIDRKSVYVIAARTKTESLDAITNMWNLKVEFEHTYAMASLLRVEYPRYRGEALSYGVYKLYDPSYKRRKLVIP